MNSHLFLLEMSRLLLMKKEIKLKLVIGRLGVIIQMESSTFMALMEMFGMKMKMEVSGTLMISP